MTKQLPKNTLVIILALLVAVAPLAIGVYLPALPVMSSGLSIPLNELQSTVSIFLLGFALGQLVGGPVSDYYGRRIVGLPGLFVFSSASFAIVFVESYEAIMLCRFLQAFGGGFATVIGGGMVMDRFKGKELAKTMALIGLVISLAPLLSPTLGGFFLNHFGWRSIFLFLGLYAMVMIPVLKFTVPERLEKPKGQLSIKKVIGDYTHVLSNKDAIGYLISIVMTYGTLLSFTTASSFAYLEYLKISPEIFPFAYGANVVCNMAFNRTTPILLRVLNPHQIMGFGLLLQLIVLVVLFIGVMYFDAGVWFVVPMIVLVAGAVGWIAPNASTCFLMQYEKNAGTANALLGSLGFMIGGIMGAIPGLLHDGTLIPMVGVMLGCVVVAVISYFFLTDPRVTEKLL